MIEEAIVLFGIKHFQQGTGGVSVDPSANLVDFINQYERVLRSDSLEGLNNFPGKRTEYTHQSDSFNCFEMEGREEGHTQHKSAYDPLSLQRPSIHPH